MAPERRMARLRDAGVNPTMQRLAILEYLEGTKSHPTADEVYTAVHNVYPTIARATVYNTLEALSQAGTILQLTLDPAAARYDADTAPHVHFRCRLCGKLYDVDVKESRCLGHEVDGHQVESIRTYAFGVCSSCRTKAPKPRKSRTICKPPGNRATEVESGSKGRSSNASAARPSRKATLENGPRGHSSNASDSTRVRRTRNA